MTEDDLIEPVRLAWAEVLDVEDIGTDTPFLEIGGNSLLLVMLWEQLAELASRPIKLADLFHHATIRAQAALLAGIESPVPAEAGARDRRRLLGRAVAKREGVAGV
ncbi:phosphopantetheine-binding protein [Kutzneria sp. NPDC052558]|uniref:phosphopantetheine-binding protein n=1 Tax=Kutzneria sp. NPDC052558 TaxID=3364121 RepID=UPI0037C77943